MFIQDPSCSLIYTARRFHPQKPISDSPSVSLLDLRRSGYLFSHLRPRCGNINFISSSSQITRLDVGDIQPQPQSDFLPQPQIPVVGQVCFDWIDVEREPDHLLVFVRDGSALVTAEVEVHFLSEFCAGVGTAVAWLAFLQLVDEDLIRLLSLSLRARVGGSDFL